MIILAIEKTEYYRVISNILAPIEAETDNQLQRMYAESEPLNSASALKTYLDTLLDQVIAAEAVDPTRYIRSLTVIPCAKVTITPTP